MTPPTMAGWNLALRFGLELAAFTGLAVGAWKLSPDNVRWLAAIAILLVAAVAWGVFNVIDDPSRSGEAPVEVSGWTRLAVELLILGGGAAAFAIVDRPSLAGALAVLIVIQYVTSWNRVEWLIHA